MSLKNKYRIVKKLTGMPVEGKLYSNSQTFNDKTIIIKYTGNYTMACDSITKCINVFDGVYNNNQLTKLWEVEIIPDLVPDNTFSGYTTTVKSGSFPIFKKLKVGFFNAINKNHSN
jgi:hypothetical protein